MSCLTGTLPRRFHFAAKKVTNRFRAVLVATRIGEGVKFTREFFVKRYRDAFHKFGLRKFWN